MAFADYTDLKAQVVRRTRRTDLTSQVPTFIQLAEARINRELKLDNKESDYSLTGVIGTRFIALPADFISGETLWQEWSWGREPKRFVPASAMETVQGSSFPNFWTIDGTNIAFERLLDQAYSFTLRYLAGLALSDAQPTNWLLTKYPDVYYQGALAEAFWDIQNNEEGDRADAKFRTALAAVDLLALRDNTLATLSVDQALRSRQRGYNIYRDGA